MRRIQWYIEINCNMAIEKNTVLGVDKSCVPRSKHFLMCYAPFSDSCNIEIQGHGH